MNYTVLTGDCLEQMRSLADRSVHCCVTSPPYFGLRDYGHAAQIGLEPTPDIYVAKLVDVFREVRRVLKDDGTLWLNIGDSYASIGRSARKESPGVGAKQEMRGVDRKVEWMPRPPGVKDASFAWQLPGGIKSKDLIGIPWMLAFALRADGWWLRQDIIWSKPNPMPESVTDRPTKAHEYLFLLSKSARYYYDAEAIKEPSKDPEDDERRIAAQEQYHKSVPDEKRNGLRARSDKQSELGKRTYTGFNGRWDNSQADRTMRNKRSVWTVATRPYAGAHFATFPPALIEPCILASCPVGGTVLDPFAGSGTTAEVALKHGRNAILCELNPDYVTLIHQRLSGLQYRIVA